MKRWIAGLAVLFLCAEFAGAVPVSQEPGSQTGAPLTTLQSISALSNAEARAALPVDFHATVTYFNRPARGMFVQDGDAALFVFLKKDVAVTSGDRVRVRGVTLPGFRPIVESGDITVLHHGNPPAAQPATYDQLIRMQLNGRLVRVRGVVRAADLLYGVGGRNIYLKMLNDGRPLDASVENGSERVLHGLLDAEVEVTGVAAGVFDSKMQQTGIMLHASSMADVKILKRASSNPWTLPIMPMDQVLRGY